MLDISTLDAGRLELRRFVRISVRDAGPGIPEGSLDRIFEAFFQEDGSATRTGRA